MKINMTRKQWAIVILLVIIVPIIYNKTSGFITGMIQKQAMKMPKEVVVDYPGLQEVSISVEETGRVEAKYSVDVIARVPGFLIKKFFKEGDFVKKGQTIFQISLQVIPVKNNCQYNADRLGNNDRGFNQAGPQNHNQHGN